MMSKEDWYPIRFPVFPSYHPNPLLDQQHMPSNSQNPDERASASKGYTITMARCNTNPFLFPISSKYCSHRRNKRNHSYTPVYTRQCIAALCSTYINLTLTINWRCSHTS